MARRSGLFLIGLVLVGAFFLLRTGSPTPGEAAITLYGVAADEPSNLYSISPANGAASLIGEITGFDDISAIAFRPSTGVLYGIGFDSDTNLVLLTINTSTGAGTGIGALGITTRRATDMSFQPSTGTLFAHLKKPDSSNSGGDIHGEYQHRRGHVCRPDGHRSKRQRSRIQHRRHALPCRRPRPLYRRYRAAASQPSRRISAKTISPSVAATASTLWMSSPAPVPCSVPSRSSVGGYNLATVATSDGAVADVGATVDNLDAIAFVPILAASPTSHQDRDRQPDSNCHSYGHPNRRHHGPEAAI